MNDRRTAIEWSLLVGGGALIASGLIELLATPHDRLPIGPAYPKLLQSFALDNFASALFAIGILALAIGHRLDLTSKRLMAFRTILIVFGIAPLVAQLLLKFPAQGAPGWVIQSVASAGAICGLISGVVLARSRAVSRYSRWAIVIVALLQVLVVALSFVWIFPVGLSVISSGLIEVSIGVYSVYCSAVAAAGAALALTVRLSPDVRGSQRARR